MPPVTVDDFEEQAGPLCKGIRLPPKLIRIHPNMQSPPATTSRVHLREVNPFFSNLFLTYTF
jgi:hypothetical protein